MRKYFPAQKVWVKKSPHGAGIGVYVDDHKKALEDLSTKIEASLGMLASRSMLGVDQLHKTHRHRANIMAPVDLDEMAYEDSTRPEITGLIFLASACKELLALLPPEALLRLQTVLQTQQFFALAEPSPDDIHRFPQGKERIQELLARPPSKARVVRP